MPHNQHCEDLIDFAVSDDWLAYYHSRGQTCRHPSPAPTTATQDRQDALEQRVKALDAQIGRLLHMLAERKQSPQERREQIIRTGVALD